MVQYQRDPKGLPGRLLWPILGLLLLVPPALGQPQGDSVSFSNDTRLPLVVQLSSIVRGGVRRDRPYPLFPGDKVRILLPGPKLVQVFDGRAPNRVLFQDKLPPTTEDLFYSIRPDPRGLPKVNLEPVRPPRRNPGGSLFP